MLAAGRDDEGVPTRAGLVADAQAATRRPTTNVAARGESEERIPVLRTVRRSRRITAAWVTLSIVSVPPRWRRSPRPPRRQPAAVAHVPPPGSHSSAETSWPLLLLPPATSTCRRAGLVAEAQPTTRRATTVHVVKRENVGACRCPRDGMSPETIGGAPCYRDRSSRVRQGLSGSVPAIVHATARCEAMSFPLADAIVRMRGGRHEPRGSGPACSGYSCPGSKSSAEARRLTRKPPATSTLPSSSSEAVGERPRASVMLPAALQPPLLGS